MSKIYSINNKESKPNNIPSIDYINEVVKMIENQLIIINKDFHGFPSIKQDIEEINTGDQDQYISAKKIKTDSRHRFINESLLTTFASKPSTFEVQQSIEQVKQEMHNKINESFMKVINSPKSINKLRDIAYILNENEAINGLLESIASKTTSEEFEEHAKSIAHMNNNDRKALNLLLDCIKNGFIDWEAKDGEVNAIKNKPESLPADGGNADTIANHAIKDIINKSTEDIVIGNSLEKYSKDACDIYAENGIIDQKILEDAIDAIGNKGVIFIKQGEYTTEYLDAQYYNLPVIYKGVDRKLTSIKINDHAKFNNTTFKHIGFKDSTIYIKSNCDLVDVLFDNCNIVLERSEMCNIKECVFNNCRISISGPIAKNIIVHNRYIFTKPIIYLSQNNIISENI